MFLVSREDFLKPGLLSSVHVFQNSYKSHLYWKRQKEHKK